MPCRALLGRDVAVLDHRHARQLQAQRIHDPGQLLACDEQVLVEFDPHGMPADSRQPMVEIVADQTGSGAFFEGPPDDGPPKRADRAGMQSPLTTLYLERAATVGVGSALRQS